MIFEHRDQLGLVFGLEPIVEFARGQFRKRGVGRREQRKRACGLQRLDQSCGMQGLAESLERALCGGGVHQVRGGIGIAIRIGIAHEDSPYRCFVSCCAECGAEAAEADAAGENQGAIFKASGESLEAEDTFGREASLVPDHGARRCVR